jgi:hypothetical protein
LFFIICLRSSGSSEFQYRAIARIRSIRRNGNGFSTAWRFQVPD